MNEQEQALENKVKEITKLVVAEIDKSKDSESPMNEVKVNRMITDLMLTMDVVNVHRAANQFETEQTRTSEQLEEYFKDVNDLSAIERKTNQEIKMCQGKGHLSRKHDDDLAERIEEFKKINDEAYLTSTMLYLAQSKENKGVNYMDVYRDTDTYKYLHRKLDNDVELRKALAVATTGSGAEWIPTGFSSQVQAVIELELKVPTLFTTLALPTNLYALPVQSSTGEGFYVPESTSDESTKAPASTPGTASPTFNARKFMGRILFSEEIREDAIVDMRAFLTSELGRMIARAEETCFLNGDREGAAGVAANHQDNQGATVLFETNWDARLAFDGLRYLALNNAGTSTKTFGNADPTDALLGSVRQLMGKYAVNPNDLVWIVSINTYLKMILLTNARTVDKYGPKATVLSGELMKYDGIPVIVSEYMFSNVDTLGVYTGTNEDRASMLLVYKPGFMRGTRGGVTLNSELDIETDQIKLVAKSRVDFIDHYDATLAANIMSAAGINIKTT